MQRSPEFIKRAEEQWSKRTYFAYTFTIFTLGVAWILYDNAPLWQIPFIIGAIFWFYIYHYVLNPFVIQTVIVQFSAIVLAATVLIYLMPEWFTPIFVISFVVVYPVIGEIVGCLLDKLPSPQPPAPSAPP